MAYFAVNHEIISLFQIIKLSFKIVVTSDKLRISLLEKFSGFSLYVTNDAGAQLYSTVCDEMLSQIEGNVRKFRTLELCNSFIS